MFGSKDGSSITSSGLGSYRETTEAVIRGPLPNSPTATSSRTDGCQLKYQCVDVRILTECFLLKTSKMIQMTKFSWQINEAKGNVERTDRVFWRGSTRCILDYIAQCSVKDEFQNVDKEPDSIMFLGVISKKRNDSNSFPTHMEPKRRSNDDSATPQAPSIDKESRKS